MTTSAAVIQGPASEPETRSVSLSVTNTSTFHDVKISFDMISLHICAPEGNVIMQKTCLRIVDSQWFNPLIIGLIVLNGIIIGSETSQFIYDSYHEWITVVNRLILAIFVIEAIVKITAMWPTPLRYFRDGWNVFDFTIVVLSLIPITGELAMIARLLRLLRVVRLISAIPELRLIVTTLIRSLPSMGHVILLMGIIFYIYAVMGYHLFHQHDPVHWNNLGLALLTLFRVVTLEDWTDVMYTAMELHPFAWLYFVSFVVLGTFVIVNLFIAVVLNNLEEAKQQRLRETKPSTPESELIAHLEEAQAALIRLRTQLDTDNSQMRLPKDN